MTSILLLPVALLLAGADDVPGARHYAVFPPSPAQVSSSEGMNGLHFSFSRWKRGLTVMFVDDIKGSVDVRGQLDTHVYRSHQRVTRSDKQRYEWQLETDGKSGKLMINGKQFELRKGTLFAVKLTGSKVVVRQLKQDFSKTESNIASCTKLVKEHSGLKKIFFDNKEPSDK